MYVGANPNSQRYPEELISLDGLVPEETEKIVNEVTYNNVETNTIVSTYIGNLEDEPQLQLIPVPFYPKPLLEDYKRGYIQRYFAKQINDTTFIEIDNNTYKNMNSKNSEYLWELYYVTKFPWQIKGDATKDELLIKAGIKNAKALITTLPYDADNLFVVLSARQLNNNLKAMTQISSYKFQSDFST